MPVGTHRRNPSAILAVPLLTAALALAACTSNRTGGTVNEPGGPTATESKVPEGQRKGFAKGATRGGRARITVNRFAWQAALDAVSFMPIRTSDPYGGVIATDWYRPQSSPNERLRVNILVSGPELTSNAVRVTVFKETRTRRGNWRPAKVADRTATDLENVILSRARRARLDANR